MVPDFTYPSSLALEPQLLLINSCLADTVNMGVTKTTHQEGTGPQAQAGQTVTIEYTGFLKDTSKPDNKGKQ